MTTTTYAITDLVAAMKSARLTASPPVCLSIGDSVTMPASYEFALLVGWGGAVSPADAARQYWRWDVMPNTMRRLA
jgi:citrate lyase beta subunit